MTRRVKKIYEENCVYHYDEQICREFAENEELHEELYKEEEEE